MATVQDVDEAIDLNLRILDPKVYKYERESVGEIVTYTFHRNGELIGKYQIVPRQEDDAICFRTIYSPSIVDAPELFRDWKEIVYILIWGAIKDRFGEHVHGEGRWGWVGPPTVQRKYKTSIENLEALAGDFVHEYFGPYGNEKDPFYNVGLMYRWGQWSIQGNVSLAADGKPDLLGGYVDYKPDLFVWEVTPLDDEWIKFDAMPILWDREERRAVVAAAFKAMLDYFDRWLISETPQPAASGAKGGQPAPTVKAVDLKPERRKVIEQACIAWAGRGALPSYDMKEFLSNLHNESGEYISRQEFKRALQEAGKRGDIRKVKGRWRPKADT